MTTKLLLNSTKPIDYTRWTWEERWVWCVCVCSNLYPHLLYLWEGATASTSWNRHKEPMGRLHVAGWRWWGPLGCRPTRVVGRPPGGTNRPQPSSAGLVWASSCLNTGVEPVLGGFASVLGLHLVHLSLILHSDIFCDFLSGQSVLATCKISSKSPAHIFKHHLWNLLINKPILAFIPYYGWIWCRSRWSKWVVSDRQQCKAQFILRSWWPKREIMAVNTAFVIVSGSCISTAWRNSSW